MKEDKTCKNFSPATYATCSSCNLDGKYTSCYGDNEKCKFRPVYKKSEQDVRIDKLEKDEVVVGYYHTVAKRYITIDVQDLYNVIAWKEITLPALPKEIKEK